MAAKKATEARPKPKKTADVIEQSTGGADEIAPSAPDWLEIERIVVFLMDGQRYALPIGVVQEIQQIVALSEIPDHQAAVVGVINVRGQVVPAVDLRLLVGMPAQQYGLQTPMLFVRTAKGLVALIVDEVEDVIEVPPNSSQVPSRMYALAEKLLCVVKLDTDLVFVFDIDRLVPADAAAAGRG
jgi:purine-binding chemotaxis protein CheW